MSLLNPTCFTHLQEEFNRVLDAAGLDRIDISTFESFYAFLLSHKTTPEALAKSVETLIQSYLFLPYDTPNDSQTIHQEIPDHVGHTQDFYNQFSSLKLFSRSLDLDQAHNELLGFYSHSIPVLLLIQACLVFHRNNLTDHAIHIDIINNKVQNHIKTPTRVSLLPALIYCNLFDTKLANFIELKKTPMPPFEKALLLSLDPSLIEFPSFWSPITFSDSLTTLTVRASATIPVSNVLHLFVVNKIKKIRVDLYKKAHALKVLVLVFDVGERLFLDLNNVEIDCPADVELRILVLSEWLLREEPNDQRNLNSISFGMGCCEVVGGKFHIWTQVRQPMVLRENFISNVIVKNQHPASQHSGLPPQNKTFKKKFNANPADFALMCGAGVAKTLNPKAPTWWNLLEQLKSLTERNGKDLLTPLEKAIVETIKNDLPLRANVIAEYLDDSVFPMKHQSKLQMIIRDLNKVTFTPPTAPYSSAIDVLKAFPGLIVTTNYDVLIEDVTDRESQVLRNELPFEDLLQFANGFIFKVHATSFETVDGVQFCLTKDEYHHSLGTKYFLDVMVTICQKKSLVFVGALTTIIDVHFIALWETLGALGSPKEHFIICSRKELPNVSKNCAMIQQVHGVTIHPVDYGTRREFQWNLIDASKTSHDPEHP